MQDLWRLSAAALAALVRSKKVSAREAATSALARLDAVNPKINAVVDHRPDDVLKQAASVDAAIARGEDVGVLAGVPVTVAGPTRTCFANCSRPRSPTAIRAPRAACCARRAFPISRRSISSIGQRLGACRGPSSWSLLVASSSDAPRR